jgi:hypothetical protein
MAWWSNNQQQPAQNTGALNLGLPNGQQQMPQMGAMGAMGAAGAYNPYAPPPPPSEMDILSAMITSNPMIDKWLSDNNGANLTMLVGLLSNIVAVSMQQMLRNAKIKETDDGFVFDFSGVQNIPTPDSVTMAQTQILNGASNNVQQMSMQFQQMVAIANQSTMQGMLDSALADPGMVQSVAQGGGTFLRSMLGGR